MNKKTPSNKSQKGIRVERVTKRTYEVFGADGDVVQWLNQPNIALNGQSPLSLLDTDMGAEMVLDTLGRIEHGDFA